jgi:hypothetical protein
MKKRIFFIKSDIKKNEIILNYYSHIKPNNFIDIVFKINNITDEKEKENYIKMYKDNESCFDNLLNEDNLLKFFEPSVTYKLFEDRIFYLDSNDNIYYLNKEIDKIIKFTKKDIIKNHFKGYKKSDLIVILPKQLQINTKDLNNFFKLNESFIKENYPNKIIFKKMLNSYYHLDNNIVGCLAKIINDTSDLKKEELVYVLDKCQKNFKDKFKVIVNNGDIKYVSKNNLNICNKKFQNEKTKKIFENKRKEKLIDEEKNGHPILVKIISISTNTITVNSFADELNRVFIIPLKIIPDFILLNNIDINSNHFLNQIFWLNLPIWFYNKNLKNI